MQNGNVHSDRNRHNLTLNNKSWIQRNNTLWKICTANYFSWRRTSQFTGYIHIGKGRQRRRITPLWTTAVPEDGKQFRLRPLSDAYIKLSCDFWKLKNYSDHQMFHLTSYSKDPNSWAMHFVKMPRHLIKVLLECMCLLSTSTYSSRFFSDLLSTF